MFGVLDLSIVTQLLIDELTTCVSESKLWDENTEPGNTVVKNKPKVSGAPPDLLRPKKDFTYISLYLFHVAPDKTHRNTYPVTNYETVDNNGKPVRRAIEQQIPRQPLPLTLYYLLSAHSESYTLEQQAMSIAMKCLHEHPILTASVPFDRANRKQEFTLSLEPENVDEIGRLWQSTSTPLRLSAVYRASVIFLKPPEVTEVIEPVKEFHVEAYILDRLSVGQIKLAPPPPPTIPPTPTDRVVARGGFIPGGLTVELDNTFLVANNQPPNQPLAPGEYRHVNPTKLEFRLPAGTVPGRHTLRLWLAAAQQLVEGVVVVP